MIRLKQIPSYVNGEFRKSPKALRRILNDFNGNPMLEVHDVNDYELMSAIKNANKVQRELGKIPMANVRRLLEDTMHNYFHNKTKYETIVKLNGSPINFVREGMDFVKNWCFCAEGFLGRALEKGNITYRNTAPIVTILPSNSEQVMLYVVAQNLLSRNATILRPSSKGAGAYNSNEFVLALNKTIDKLNQKELSLYSHEHNRSILSTALL